MPTTRPRHTVTETEPVARALDDAARQWPDDAENRAQLLLRLLEEGHRVIVERHEQHVQRRKEAILRTSGALSGLYEEGYLEKLREDWPP